MFSNFSLAATKPKTLLIIFTATKMFQLTVFVFITDFSLKNAQRNAVPLSFSALAVFHIVCWQAILVKTTQSYSLGGENTPSKLAFWRGLGSNRQRWGMNPACFHYTTPPFELKLTRRILTFFFSYYSSYQLHVPVRLPCYDFVPVKNLPRQAAEYPTTNEKISLAHLRQAFFQAVTGGLYKTPEPVHRNLADLRLLAIPSSRTSNCRRRFVLGKHFFHSAGAL